MNIPKILPKKKEKKVAHLYFPKSDDFRKYADQLLKERNAQLERENLEYKARLKGLQETKDEKEEDKKILAEVSKLAEKKRVETRHKQIIFKIQSWVRPVSFLKSNKSPRPRYLYGFALREDDKYNLGWYMLLTGKAKGKVKSEEVVSFRVPAPNFESMFRENVGIVSQLKMGKFDSNFDIIGGKAEFLEPYIRVEKEGNQVQTMDDLLLEFLSMKPSGTSLNALMKELQFEKKDLKEIKERLERLSRRSLLDMENTKKGMALKIREEGLNFLNFKREGMKVPLHNGDNNGYTEKDIRKLQLEINKWQNQALNWMHRTREEEEVNAKLRAALDEFEIANNTITVDRDHKTGALAKMATKFADVSNELTQALSSYQDAEARSILEARLSKSVLAQVDALHTRLLEVIPRGVSGVEREKLKQDYAEIASNLIRLMMASGSLPGQGQGQAVAPSAGPEQQPPKSEPA